MVGNSRFQKLVEIINAKYRSDFGVKGTKGLRPVSDIRKRILEERLRGSTETIDLFGECFRDREIQDLLGFKKPQITDYSELLGLEPGRVYGLELRLMGPSGSHKGMMIGSLLLMQLMAAQDPEKDTIVDAGFYNSARATKYYAELFGLNGVYFIQESTPGHLLRELNGDNFEVVPVPLPQEGSDVDKKNATYMALLDRFRDRDFRRRAYHLGHAELGFFATFPHGRMIAKLLESDGIKPDVFFTPVGAGTTLVGIGEPLKSAFGTELWVGEYEEYGPVKKEVGNDRFYGIIHPDLSFISRITRRFTSSSDEAVRQHLSDFGYHVGITSAGSLISAAHIVKEQPGTIVVPIFEEYRDYGPDARCTISREIQLNPFIPKDFWNKVDRVYHLEKKVDMLGVPWLFKGETPAQKIAEAVFTAAYASAASAAVFFSDPRAPWHMIN